MYVIFFNYGNQIFILIVTKFFKVYHPGLLSIYKKIYLYMGVSIYDKQVSILMLMEFSFILKHEINFSMVSINSRKLQITQSR